MIGWPEHVAQAKRRGRIRRFLVGLFFCAALGAGLALSARPALIQRAWARFQGVVCGP